MKIDLKYHKDLLKIRQIVSQNLSNETFLFELRQSQVFDWFNDMKSINEINKALSNSQDFSVHSISKLLTGKYELDFVDSFKIENYIFFAGFKGKDSTPDLKELIISHYKNVLENGYYNNALSEQRSRSQYILSEISVLHEITRAFEDAKSLDNLLHYIVDHARSLMRTESASLMLHIPETNELEFKVVLGPKSEEVKPFRLAMGKGIAGWVAQNKEPILIPDAYQDERFDPSFDKRSGYRTKSILCVPLLHKGKTIGVMTVLNRLDDEPFNENDKNSIFSFASQAALAIENARLIQTEIEKERLDKELQVAAEIQRLLLPSEIPAFPQLQISASYLPCKEVSGDYFNIFKADENNLIVVVADVAGKGIPAAMMVSNMQAKLAAYLEESRDLISIVTRLNSMIKNSMEDRFITFFIGIYNSLEEKLSYINAGHNPPILFNNRIQELKTGGIFIGSLPWQYEKETIAVRKNDILIFYTDGLVEAMNDKKEDFGEKRVFEIIKKNKMKSAEEIQNEIKYAVKKHIQTSQLEDDFTLIVIKKHV